MKVRTILNQLHNLDGEVDIQVKTKDKTFDICFLETDLKKGTVSLMTSYQENENLEKKIDDIVDCATSVISPFTSLSPEAIKHLRNLENDASVFSDIEKQKNENTKVRENYTAVTKLLEHYKKNGRVPVSPYTSNFLVNLHNIVGVETQIDRVKEVFPSVLLRGRHSDRKSLYKKLGKRYVKDSQNDVPWREGETFSIYIRNRY